MWAGIQGAAINRKDQKEMIKATEQMIRDESFDLSLFKVLQMDEGDPSNVQVLIQNSMDGSGNGIGNQIVFVPHYKSFIVINCNDTMKSGFSSKEYQDSECLLLSSIVLPPLGYLEMHPVDLMLIRSKKKDMAKKFGIEIHSTSYARAVHALGDICRAVANMEEDIVKEITFASSTSEGKFLLPLAEDDIKHLYVKEIRIMFSRCNLNEKIISSLTSCEAPICFDDSLPMKDRAVCYDMFFEDEGCFERKPLTVSFSRNQRQDDLPSIETVVESIKRRNLKSITIESKLLWPQKFENDFPKEHEIKSGCVLLYAAALKYGVHLEFKLLEGKASDIWDDAQREYASRS